MAAARRALIVATGEYEHGGLARLLSPAADADALAGVLADPKIGGFEVEVVRDQPAHDIQAKIEDLFSEARPDDVLVLHFSCHGLKNEAGKLYFAARNTRPNRLASSAVSADFVQGCVRNSRSSSIVLFLDCCYGGAFGQGVAVRAGGDVNVLDSFPTGRLGGGRGRAVISASNAVEYAFEGEALVDGEGIPPSHFTAAVVQGLATGEADRDQDGWVSLNELYDYVFDKVREVSPNQTPSRDIEMQGELYLARSNRKVIRPIAVPAELRAAAQDPSMYSRVGAVAELRSRLLGENLPVAVGARELLLEIAADDIEFVAQKASAALGDAALVVSESPVQFGQVTQGLDVVRIITLSGPPIALAATAGTPDAKLRLTPGDGWLEVGLDTGDVGGFAGTIVFTGPAGETVLPVDGQVVAPASGRGRAAKPNVATAQVVTGSRAASPSPAASSTPTPTATATSNVAPTPTATPTSKATPAPSPRATTNAGPTPTPPPSSKSASTPKPKPPLATDLTEPGDAVLGAARLLLLAGLFIMLVSLTMPWFDENLRVTILDWNSEVNGIFLPQVWGTLALGLLALAGLVTGLRPAIVMGLAGVTGYSAFWIAVYAATAPSDVHYGDFVYGFGGLVIAAGVALWVRQVLTVRSQLRESHRSLVLIGSALIVVPEALLIGDYNRTLNIVYFVVMVSLSAAVLVPRRINDSVRIGALVGITANGLLELVSVANYLSRFSGEQGAKLTDGNGKLALEAVVAVGMWVALGRTRDPA